MADRDDAKADYGRVLRAMRRRAGLSQGQLALVANSSTSVVSRAERAIRVPDRLTAERLDEALRAEGELVARWLAAVGGPTDRLVPATRWVHNYPTAYHGLIWMRWTASDDEVEEVVVDVKWGRWRLRRRVPWPDSRDVTVWHTKGDDGLSIPVIVRCSNPVTVTFHVGEPPANAIDINPGWIDEQD